LFEDFPQSEEEIALSVSLRLGLDDADPVRLDDLRNGPVGFGVRGVDVAAGGDVVVVLLQLGVVDDAAEFFLLLPPDEGVGDALDAGVGDEVLGVALFEDLAGVDEEDLALARLGLGLVQEQHDAGGGGVVEEVFRQVEHALDEVVVHEPLADGLFLVGAGIARAAGGGAGVEHDGGAALSFRLACMCCTQPQSAEDLPGKPAPAGKRSSSSLS
jgi:hypothetical protein